MADRILGPDGRPMINGQPPVIHRPDGAPAREEANPAVEIHRILTAIESAKREGDKPAMVVLEALHGQGFSIVIDAALPPFCAAITLSTKFSLKGNTGLTGQAYRVLNLGSDFAGIVRELLEKKNAAKPAQPQAANDGEKSDCGE